MMGQAELNLIWATLSAILLCLSDIVFMGAVQVQRITILTIRKVSDSNLTLFSELSWSLGCTLITALYTSHQIQLDCEAI